MKTDSPTPAAPAEVCERLKQMVRWSEQMHATYLSFFGVTDPQVQAAKEDLATLTAALSLIEQGEKERERFYMEYRTKCDVETKALCQQLAAATERVKRLEQKAIEGRKLRHDLRVTVADLVDRLSAARAQPTPESK